MGGAGPVDPVDLEDPVAFLGRVGPEDLVDHQGVRSEDRQTARSEGRRGHRREDPVGRKGARPDGRRCRQFFPRWTPTVT